MMADSAYRYLVASAGIVVKRNTCYFTRHRVSPNENRNMLGRSHSMKAFRLQPALATSPDLPRPSYLSSSTTRTSTHNRPITR
jgi:hypothetical protein